VVNVPPLVHGLDTPDVLVLRFHRLAVTEKLNCAVTIEHTRLSLALSTISVCLGVTKRGNLIAAEAFVVLCYFEFLRTMYIV